MKSWTCCSGPVLQNLNQILFFYFFCREDGKTETVPKPTGAHCHPLAVFSWRESALGSTYLQTGCVLVHEDKGQGFSSDDRTPIAFDS